MEIKKKKLLLKYYFEFDKSLKKLGEKHKTNIGKFRINTIYNTFGFFSPRLYVGLKFLELTIIKLSRKYKIKNIFYYKDLKNFYLDSYFYEKVLRKICKESKIRLEVKSEKKTQILNIDKFINLLRKINYFLKEANFLKIKLIVKKIFAQSLFFLKKKETLLLEPAYDLNYYGFNIWIKYLKTNSFFEKIYRKTKKNFSDQSSDIENLKNLKDLFLKYLYVKNKELELYYLSSYQQFSSLLKKNKIKKIFWGLSPDYLYRNVLLVVKKSYKVFGFQHGAGYGTNQEDMFHRDGDYNQCNTYFSYGMSKKFNHKKYASKVKIIEMGSLKESCMNLNYSQSYKKKILYIPIAFNNFLVPSLESTQFERMKQQIDICLEINKLKNCKSFIKLMPNTISGEKIINYENLELNPIYLELKSFKNIQINDDSVEKAIKKIKPNVIITDAFSTPLFEAIKTNASIICFIDKQNIPKSDVMSLLKKRVYIPKNPREMTKILNKELNKDNRLAIDKNFYNKFYKLKKSLKNVVH